MSNLQSTVPGAFNAFYNLLATAGAGQSPAIPVFHSEVIEGQFTGNGYVLLYGVDNHEFDMAALGSYAAYETYDVVGAVVFYQGGPDITTMAENVLNSCWSIYQAVVMTTAVTNRGANGTQVLGGSAPAALEWFIPLAAEYRGEPGQFGTDVAGFQGQVEFRYQAKARITVP